MKFKLNKIVPWGRSYDEYVKMFSLDNNTLKLRILSVADGPASFNYKVTSKNGNIVSIDPLYQFTSYEIKSRIDEVYETVLKKTQKNKDKFIWTNIHSIEELGKIRMEAMKEFLFDFEEGKDQKRYIPAELPNIPFKNKAFDLCLSSHFLFLYSKHLSVDFHKQTITEMLRVSSEVRIFPLLTLDGNKSEYIKPVIDDMINKGYNATIERVNYEFQRGGNEMLRINKL